MRRRISHGERRETTLGGRLGQVAFAILSVVFLIVVANFLGLDQWPEHFWRTIGPGSNEYEQCYAKMRQHAGRFEVDEIDADRAGTGWVFRWHITALAKDNSPTHPAIYTCVHRDGRAKLREPTYPLDW